MRRFLARTTGAADGSESLRRGLSRAGFALVALACWLALGSLANFSARGEDPAKKSPAAGETPAAPEAPEEPASEGDAPATEQGDEDASSDKPAFIRVTRDDRDEPKAMETAIVSYTKTKVGDEEGEDLVVDLIGAVHIGELSYYDALNKEFQAYDALLYELVAPEGARPRPGESGESAVSMLQNGMKSMLDLEFQLDRIDYEKHNFVHADMSPEEFAKSMEERGESIWTIVFRMLGQGLAQQSLAKDDTSDADILMALFDPRRALKLKRILAHQFENMEGSMGIFEGPEGSVIITERNKKAFSVLKREIAAGKKRIGVFYGAGHLADMEKRLLADFGLKRGEERWLECWNLRLDEGEKNETAE